MVGKALWPQEYYHALEHYYWEPQKLNRHANAKRGKNEVEEVLRGLHKSETALNHILNVFFNIAPHPLVTRFFRRFLSGWPEERVENHSRIDMGFCQPDFLFEGQESRIAIEMKIDEKTSLEQIVKYALLLRFHQGEGDKPMLPFLLYLCRDCKKVWRNGLTFSTFHDALSNVNYTGTIQRYATKSGLSQEEVVSLARELPVAHLTYTEFSKFLHGEIEGLHSCEGAMTLRNLVNGLISELATRGLVAEAG
jgi:hypothetical protein